MTPNLPNGEVPKGQQLPASRGTAADPAGLTDSLHRFRGKTPQESLGLAPGNGLMWPFVQASAVTAVVLVALTVGPYVLDKPSAAAANSGQPTKTESPEANAPTPPPASTPAKAGPDTTAKKPATGPAEPTKPAAGAKKDITEVLGESGTKTASPKVNPLDKKEDDLLKDIK